MESGWEVELNKELKRLQLKYQTGFEIRLEFQPEDVQLRPRHDRGNGKKYCVNGEWMQGKIIIYENESLEKCIHVLHHEFIESVLLSDLVDPYVILSNALQNVFKTLNYMNQEKRIEALAKMEDLEYGQRVSGKRQ